MKLAVLAAAIAAVMLVACNRTTNESTSLKAVNDAALRVRAHISVGVTQVEFPKPLYDLAYEIIRADEAVLSSGEKKALEQYSKALEIYKASMKIWEAHSQYDACMARFSYDSKYCQIKNAEQLANAAELSVGSVRSNEAVQLAWEVAAQKLGKANELASAP